MTSVEVMVEAIEKVLRESDYSNMAGPEPHQVAVWAAFAVRAALGQAGFTVFSDIESGAY